MVKNSKGAVSKRKEYEQDDHEKNRNYWKYLKAKLRKEKNELVSATTQLKLTAVIPLPAAEGKDDDLASGTKAEGDETTKTCSDKEGLFSFSVPVIELPA